MSSSREDPSDEISRIADQLRRVCDGPSWLGPSLKELLSGIDQPRAQHRPIATAHTIWELILHIAAWMRIARERLSATKTRDHSAEENWPAQTPTIAGAWTDALETLNRELDQLEQAILAFPPERLNHTAPASEPQTFYILLHGVVQHIAYHAGQIAILKK